MESQKGFLCWSLCDLRPMPKKLEGPGYISAITHDDAKEDGRRSCEAILSSAHQPLKLIVSALVPGEKQTGGTEQATSAIAICRRRLAQLRPPRGLCELSIEA